MAEYLSQDWLDLQRELASNMSERPGATARMQYVVTGGPGGEVHFHIAVVDGRITEASLGDDPEAEFTLTQTRDVAIQVLRGELDANAAFMQGKVKVTGNMGKLMSLIPFTQSPEYQAVQASLAEQTEY